MPNPKCHCKRISGRFVALLICSAFLLGGSLCLAQSPTARRKVYVAPFSHLDLFWAGTRADTLSRGNKIIAKAIEIADKHPQFRFFIETDNFLANFVQSHEGTKELADLRRLVREGRIGIAPNWAGIFISLPAGEVQVRNMLYGKLYARDVFGVNPLAIQPDDIPGFFSQYPQMLREADIPFLVMSRMGPVKKSLFDWKSPDGSRVLVWNEWMHRYGWGVDLGLQKKLTPERLQRIRKEVGEVQATTPGPVYLPWGMDLWAPPESLVSNLGLLNRDLPSDRFIFATPQGFFQTLGKAPRVPELSGGIPMGWPDTADGMVALWQLAPPATNILTTAEEFSAINDALGYAPYPQADLDLLWKKLIESMDHNNGGQGWEMGDARKKEDSEIVIMRGREIRRNMLRNIAERVRIPVARGVPIVVFNGLGWPRDGLVKAHVTVYGNVVPGNIAEYRKGMNLVDAAGKVVPYAVEETSESMSEALDIVFEATGVPSLGYKTYYLVPAVHPKMFPPAAQVSLEAGKTGKGLRGPRDSAVMENQFYKVTVDKTTGKLTVFDRQLGRDITKGMRIVAEEERGSNNVQPERNTGVTFPMAVTGIKLEENSPVRTVLKISGSVGRTPVVQRLMLYRGLKRLDIENSVDWTWGLPYIRMEQLFPVAQSNSREMVFGVPFGADSMKSVMLGSGPHAPDEIDRSAWEHYREMHGWLFAGSSKWGVTLAADHPLVYFQPGLIRAEMLREPDENGSVRIFRGNRRIALQYPPSGRYNFKYSLSSGTGDWKAQLSYQAGRNLNSPLMPVEVVDDVSTKSLPPADSFCSVKGDDLVISALKKSQANRSIILRLYEIQGKKVETPVIFLGKRQEFRETNLLEQNLGSTNEQLLHVGPYQIKTLRLKP